MSMTLNCLTILCHMTKPYNIEELLKTFERRNLIKPESKSRPRVFCVKPIIKHNDDIEELSYCLKIQSPPPKKKKDKIKPYQVDPLLSFVPNALKEPSLCTNESSL